jgi:hypothetical protein
MTMNEIGLLITDILTARQMALTHKLPKQQPFRMDNSSERLTENHLTQLAYKSQIAPPEFISTDAIFVRSSSVSPLRRDQLLHKIKNRELSPVALTLVKNSSSTSLNNIKIAAGPSAFRGGSNLPTLRFGSSGPAVRILQRLLVANGYAIRVDGAFGPLTETAVKAFQNQRRVGVDGIVGPVTWRQLSI